MPVKLNNETVALENEQRRTQPELRSRVKNDIHATNEEPPSKDKNLSIQQRKILVKLTEQISGLEGKQTLVNNGERLALIGKFPVHEPGRFQGDSSRPLIKCS